MKGLELEGKSKRRFQICVNALAERPVTEAHADDQLEAIHSAQEIGQLSGLAAGSVHAGVRGVGGGSRLSARVDVELRAASVQRACTGH